MEALEQLTQVDVPCCLPFTLASCIFATAVACTEIAIACSLLIAHVHGRSALECILFTACIEFQKLQRDVNCLLDENRSTRRRALERLQKEIAQSSLHPKDVIDGLLEFLIKPLLRVFSDPVEKCRELAIGIIAK